MAGTEINAEGVSPPGDTSSDRRRVTSPARPDESGRALVGLLAFAGGGLLIASELADCLEVDLGLSVPNLIFASLLASLLVCAAALAGDSLLAAVADRRAGRRPGTALVSPLLTLAGVASASGIFIDHMRHAIALDGLIGLGGSILLLLAAAANHHLSRAASRGSR